MGTHGGPEAEIKLPVDEIEAVRGRLRATGWRCTRSATRERNLVLDSADRTLTSAGRLLRLRTFGEHTVLTAKGPAHYQGSVKTRREVEVMVAEADTCLAIFEELGFRVTITYEKDRELWRRGALTVALDHTPMGDFVEVEGEVTELTQAATDLGLDPSRALRGSYLSLWQEYRLRHPEKELAQDMVFSP
jgi:adenylate cyclase class 2